MFLKYATKVIEISDFFSKDVCTENFNFYTANFSIAPQKKNLALILFLAAPHKCIVFSKLFCTFVAVIGNNKVLLFF
jgi:hypothetical protein